MKQTTNKRNRELFFSSRTGYKSNVCLWSLPKDYLFCNVCFRNLPETVSWQGAGSINSSLYTEHKLLWALSKTLIPTMKILFLLLAVNRFAHTSNLPHCKNIYTMCLCDQTFLWVFLSTLNFQNSLLCFFDLTLPSPTQRLYMP